jgi:4a-hydroxytetrahydrobiopterin dehydratase
MRRMAGRQGRQFPSQLHPRIQSIPNIPGLPPADPEQRAGTGRSECPRRPFRRMLQQQHCEPCTRATPPVPADEAQRLRREIPEWKLEGKRLVREWRMQDFQEALALANAIGALAEREQHHPDLHLTDYKRLRVELSTHAIHALSRNDFVLAAKIDALPEAACWPAPAPQRS